MYRFLLKSAKELLTYLVLQRINRIKGTGDDKYLSEEQRQGYKVYLARDSEELYIYLKKKIEKGVDNSRHIGYICKCAV